MTTPDTQQKLQTLSEEYQKLQTDLQTQITSLHRLESQKTENTSVRSTLSATDPSANIYKLIGPVLLKQDKQEAESAVEGRLEFIGNEMKRVEKLIAEMQEKSEGKKMEVYQLQMKLQEGN
ncbi:MAG: hypothetical protein LQ338_000690 [Usnochroma carphineum]|nr:MAG: hypothetical protein LQ338_000690 [Usnochroma carphineum]